MVFSILIFRRKYYCLANSLYVTMNWENIKAQNKIMLFMDYHPKNKLRKMLNQNENLAFLNHEVYRQKKFKLKRRLELQTKEWDSRLRVSFFKIFLIIIRYFLLLRISIITISWD